VLARVWYIWQGQKGFRISAGQGLLHLKDGKKHSKNRLLVAAVNLALATATAYAPVAFCTAIAVQQHNRLICTPGWVVSFQHCDSGYRNAEATSTAKIQENTTKQHYALRITADRLLWKDKTCLAWT